MTHSEIKARISKKCWPYFGKLAAAKNFMEVEDLLGNAFTDFCGLRNTGVEKIRARQAGTYDKTVEATTTREQKFLPLRREVMRELVEYIPERLNKCAMYRAFCLRENLYETCEECYGEGVYNGDVEVVCTSCGGHGKQLIEL